MEFSLVIGVLVFIITLLTVIAYLSKLSDVGLSLAKWFFIGCICLIAIWGLYNQMSNTFGYWEPITFDYYIDQFITRLQNLLKPLFRLLGL